MIFQNILITNTVSTFTGVEMQILVLNFLSCMVFPVFLFLFTRNSWLNLSQLLFSLFLLSVIHRVGKIMGFVRKDDDRVTAETSEDCTGSI